MLLLLLYLFKSCLNQDFCNSCKLLISVVIYFVNVFSWEILHQGPVVESITSLKMLLVKDSWRSGVRSAMRAASQLPGRGPTVVDMAPIPAR